MTTSTNSLGAGSSTTTDVPDKPLVAPGSEESEDVEDQETDTLSSSEESSDEGGKGDEPDAVIELRRKVTEQGDKLAGYEDLVSTASAHPDWTMQQVFAYFQTGQAPNTKSEEADPFEDLYPSLVGDKPEDRKALSDFANRVANRAVEAVMNKMKPVIAKTYESDVDTKFDKGLRQGGLDSEQLRDNDDYEEFKTTYIQQNKWWRAVLKDDPIQAGKFVGEAYAKKLGKSGASMKQRDKVSLAKDSMLEKNGSRGSATKTAANTVTLSRGATMQQIRPYIAAGKKVIFKD